MIQFVSSKGKLFHNILPNPNRYPSANRVLALWKTQALSTARRNVSAFSSEQKQIIRIKWGTGIQKRSVCRLKEIHGTAVRFNDAGVAERDTIDDVQHLRGCTFYRIKSIIYTTGNFMDCVRNGGWKSPLRQKSIGRRT